MNYKPWVYIEWTLRKPVFFRAVPADETGEPVAAGSTAFKFLMQVEVSPNKWETYGTTNISNHNMKKLLTASLILLLFAYCGFSNKHKSSNRSLKLSDNNQDSKDYYIFQIDSLNNTYIICAKSGGNQYKIITTKKSYACDNKIQIGNTYHLKIEGFIHKFIPRDGVMPAAGLLADSATYLKFEDGFVKDFYITKDLRGLCIIN